MDVSANRPAKALDFEIAIWRNMPDSVKAGTRPKATREVILNSALELFREQSFESTTMREIARNAGVALGAAYYYFESKDAIVLAFYEHAQQEMAPLLEHALSSTRDLRERLRGLITVKLEYFAPSRRFVGRTQRPYESREPPLSLRRAHPRDPG